MQRTKIINDILSYCEILSDKGLFWNSICLKIIHQFKPETYAQVQWHAKQQSNFVQYFETDINSKTKFKAFRMCDWCEHNPRAAWHTVERECAQPFWSKVQVSNVAASTQNRQCFYRCKHNFALTHTPEKNTRTHWFCSACESLSLLIFQCTQAYHWHTHTRCKIKKMKEWNM